MALARFHGTAFALSGSSLVAAPSAVVTVRREDTGALASLFSDRDGLVGISNPTTADASGTFSFHAAALEDGYRITVTEASSPGTELSYRYVQMGTLGEYANPMSTKGDLMVRGSGTADTPVRKGAGLDGYPLIPSSGATDGLAYAPPGLGFTLVGGYLEWSVVGSPTSTLSVAIKAWGSPTTDPSDSDPVFIAFRDPTAADGRIRYRKITAATSITINSTALLGTVTGVPFRLWCAAFDDGGTIRLALINCLSSSAGAGAGRNVTALYQLKGWGIASSTQEGDTSDSAQTFYSDGAAVSSKAYATLGYATWESGLANAGNWNTGPTRIQAFGPGVPLPGEVIQTQRNDTGAVATGTTVLPSDDSIPQIGEGDQYMTQAITPTSAANALAISVAAIISSSVGPTHLQAALFQDATANALKSTAQAHDTAGFLAQLELEHLMLAATTSATTFRTRAGAGNAGTTTFNGIATAIIHGGVMNSFMQVVEVMA